MGISISELPPFSINKVFFVSDESSTPGLIKDGNFCFPPFEFKKMNLKARKGQKAEELAKTATD